MPQGHVNVNKQVPGREREQERECHRKNKSERERETESEDLGISGSKSEVSRFSWVHALLASLKQKAREGRRGVTQAISYLDYPGLSERGSFMIGGSLTPTGCFTSSCVYSWQYVYSRWKSLKWMPQQSKA